MKHAAGMIPIILYLIVGIVSLVMARKCLFSKSFVLFHEKAAGTSMEKLDQKIQNVVLALMRTTGLGFLIVGIFLVAFPIMNFFKPDLVSGLGIPFVCEIYCLGLFIANYRLHRKAGVGTPWKGSLVAAAMLLLGMLISFL